MTELEGATNAPEPYTRLKDAGEFAAMWNSLAPPAREALFQTIQSASEDGYRCFMEGHESLKIELGRLRLGVIISE